MDQCDASMAKAAVRYTHTAVVLHWVIALLIFAALALGLYMVGLKLTPLKLKLYSWHKWLGVTIWMLAVARVLWRATHRPPPAPAMPAWQHAAAGASHALLYGLLLAIPITGWLFSSASGFPVVYLGLVQLPDLVAKNKELANVLKAVHAYLNYTLMAVVALHVLASLKHHVIDRDDVLHRMLPLIPPPRPRP
jgi:cytochrome b561